MNNGRNSLSISIAYFFMLVSLLILTDFLLPGEGITDTVNKVKKEHQDYNNPARNSHFSYRVFTSTRDFSVSKEIASAVNENQKIEYSVSRIF